MAATADDTRHWSARLRAEPAPLPELGEFPMPIELARAYVYLALAYREQHPVFVEALEEMYGITIGMRAEVESMRRELGDIALATLSRGRPGSGSGTGTSEGPPSRPSGAGSLPAMRPRTDSTHEVASAVSRDIIDTYEAELRDPATPPQVSRQKMEQIIDERVSLEIARIKNAQDAAKWHAVEAERNAAEAERVAQEEDRRALQRITTQYRTKAKWTLIVGILTTTVSALGWLIDHFAK